MFSETWYSDDGDVFDLPIYNGYFPNRTTGRGGGPSLMLRDNMCGEVLEEYSNINKDYEVLSLLVNKNLISVFYRPPDGSLTSFFAFLETYFRSATENRYNIISGGDFNLNMLQDITNKRQLEVLINSSGCMNSITSPTRITAESSTLVGLFITSFELPCIKSGIISTDISDHLGIFLCVKKEISKTAMNRF